MRLSGILLGILCCFFITSLHAQEFTPVVKQFSKNDYGASNQNWSVAQSQDGMMYFGNNEGLLQFDGAGWQIYRLPQNKIVRALYVDPKGRIFAGSFEEFGYFEKSSDGKLQYTSLSADMKKYDMQNDEIWTIFTYQNKIIFQSFTSFFEYDGKTVTGHRMPVTFLFFHPYKKDIFTHTTQFGFSKINVQIAKIEPLQLPGLSGQVINTLVLPGGKAVLVTKSNGLFAYDGQKAVPMKTDADAWLMKSEVNKALITRSGTIVLGSILQGIVALNANGKLLWSLNRNNVLQNNTVLGMCTDKDDNLWVALDKGIAYVQLNAKVKYLAAFQPSVGAVYDVLLLNNQFYLATNQGLYEADYNPDRKNISSMVLKSNIKGQVWSLEAVDQQILCGTNDATLKLFSAKADFMSPVQGGMCIRKGMIHGREVLVQGTYTSLCIYVRQGSQWLFSHEVEGFVNPVRYLEIDYKGTIWATHLHQGMFAIQLSKDLKKAEKIEEFNTLDGKNQSNMNVFQVNNRVVFTDHQQFYTYDDIRKVLIPYDKLNQGLGYFSSSYRVALFFSNYYWFIRDDAAALYEVKDDQLRLIDIVQYSLFKNQIVDNNQNIVPISENECLFTLENGLALYTLEDKKSKGTAYNLMLREVMTSDARGEVFHHLNLMQTLNPRIRYSQNNVRFSVYCPDYTALNNLKYSFKLEGLDQVWSEPVDNGTKLYSYLPAGSYTLHARVVTHMGEVLSELCYEFVVKPPFYWSLVAKILYFLLVVVSLLMFIQMMRRRYQRNHDEMQRQEEELRRHEIEKREQQIMALENEKLEGELTLKSKELAGSTMSLIKKNEFLLRLKEELAKQKTSLGTQYPNKYYDKLTKMIDENLSSEDDWLIFQSNFDRIHENFFRNLHRDFPELTSNDLRFCAYLRLNLSSKDIAHLMNISLKGVEVARYRIRKKIDLPSSKNLTEFMIEFK